MPVISVMDLNFNKLESANFLALSKFTCLKILNLSKNSLASIEPLASADLPSLELLDLSKIQNILDDNKITNLRPLRRALLQNVKQVRMTNNHILEFDSLTEIDQHSAELFVFNQNDSYRIVSTLAKMPTRIVTNYKKTSGPIMKRVTF